MIVVWVMLINKKDKKIGYLSHGSSIKSAADGDVCQLGVMLIKKTKKLGNCLMVVVWKKTKKLGNRL